MKTLITSNDKGECVSCMTASSDKYYTCIQDIDLSKYDIVGYDIEQQKVITISKSTPSYRKKEIYDKLKQKNELYNTKLELIKVKKDKKELEEINIKINAIQLALADLDSGELNE